MCRLQEKSFPCSTTNPHSSKRTGSRYALDPWRKHSSVSQRCGVDPGSDSGLVGSRRLNLTIKDEQRSIWRQRLVNIPRQTDYFSLWYCDCCDTEKIKHDCIWISILQCIFFYGKYTPAALLTVTEANGRFFFYKHNTISITDLFSFFSFSVYRPFFVFVVACLPLLSVGVFVCVFSVVSLI